MHSTDMASWLNEPATPVVLQPAIIRPPKQPDTLTTPAKSATKDKQE